jgi:putative hydrolase of the HAD superfamily
MSLSAPRPAPRGFAQVETWVFDLDNTLYPHHLNLWQQVDARIRDFIAAFLAVGAEEAYRVQKDYYRRYGTTLRGLMIEHGIAPDDFLEFVHAIDHRRSSRTRRSAPRSSGSRAASSSSRTAPASTRIG